RFKAQQCCEHSVFVSSCFTPVPRLRLWASHLTLLSLSGNACVDGGTCQRKHTSSREKTDESDCTILDTVFYRSDQHYDDRHCWGHWPSDHAGWQHARAVHDRQCRGEWCL